MTALAFPRRQLSLFVPAPHAAALEAARAVLDPIQHSLIPAHVTACRDAEMHALQSDDLDRRIAAARRGPLTLSFGPAIAFDGHGILLPCIAGEDALHAFRTRLLGDALHRREAPHITLAHPRNPKAAGNDLARAHELPERIEITFAEAALIEQAPGEPWRVLRRFGLE